ncbi:MAG: DNA mismatch repair protein MutS [Dehalococcoidia bacterium]|nr:DNA mismatch repair protein MutS [Dehalococcoidia bacterium]
MSTPIRRQYLELKQRYPDTILFFRLGDFYETFDEDARIAASELQITLTSKPMGKDVRVPLAGVPYHSIDGHVAKLVSRGYRVAICEQMADAADVKGLVPREVVRVVTAGTVTADASLVPDAPNYLAALAIRRSVIAVALADITTGEVRVASGEEALAELARTVPAELLCEDPSDVPPGLSPLLRNRMTVSDTAVSSALSSLFGDHGRASLLENDAEAAAVAHLVLYLGETYRAALGAMTRVRRVPSAGILTVDQRTLRNLDVVAGSGRTGSLFQVLNHTRTPMGARMLRGWLTRPLRDRVALDHRLDATGWAATNPIVREQSRAVLRSIADIERLAGKIGARSAGPRDLDALRSGLRGALELGAVLERSDLPTALADARRGLAAAVDHLVVLDAALADDPPSTFDEGGVIRGGFRGDIDSLHAMTRDARGFLLGIEGIERERTGIRSLKVGHNRVFGYYIEVSTANAALVPDHYQRRQTLVGAERYVTEELKEYESQLVGARERLIELEKQAFAGLVESLAANLPQLQSLAEALATLDVTLALGEAAATRDYVRPVFGENDAVIIRGGRHPVVEDALGPGRFVPNDCILDADTQIVVLTGPNMSGKSTFLRQVALIALMAQAGSFVPADHAELPLFDRIFTRIGAQDDLAAGQSTFMVEMVETAQILHQATPASLVVLDEVGRGTSTFDGMAIARAVVEFLHNRKEVAARTLFATHYHELTALAGLLPRVHNAHVAVREDGADVVFEHRIVPGPSDRSYGIHVARLAGLPAPVVARAEHLLAELETGRSAPNPQRETSPSATQPSFFAEPSAAESALAELDPDALSPLEAIQKLYELRALARPDTRK